jgi:hypothetical protein
MRRETAGRELLESLDRVGIRSGGIDLPVIWPVVASWWRVPVSDVAPEDDERAFYLSLAPAAADRTTTTVFAGEPPSAIAGIDLVEINFERQFSQRVDAITTEGLDGGAAVSLWYAAVPEWERLRDDPAWIDMGISTPHFDSSADGRHVERLIADLQRSAVFEIASRKRALALVFTDSESEDIVLLATSAG